MGTSAGILSICALHVLFVKLYQVTPNHLASTLIVQF